MQWSNAKKAEVKNSHVFSQFYSFMIQMSPYCFPTGQMQLSELQEIASSLGQAVISGKISSILGFNISSMTITNPLPRPSDSGWIKVRKCN